MDAWWHEVWVTLQAEFADLGDARQLTQITVRLLIAALLGGILGFEREHKGKAAGVRTHMLVAMGAALFVLVPQMSGNQADASSQISAGVSSGARRVVTAAIATDRARSPRASQVMTLEDVPLGQQPTRITPTAISGGRWKI